MFTDLGKDWSHGPPSDFCRFIPMIYIVKLDLHNYEINTYVNDLNIIDKPLLRDDNGLSAVISIDPTLIHVSKPCLLYEARAFEMKLECP
jgi:hypothetical protein